jgi:hypothetical protein
MENEKGALIQVKPNLMMFLSIFFIAMAVGMFIQEYIIHAKECGSSNFLSFIMGFVVAVFLFYSLRGF